MAPQQIKSESYRKGTILSTQMGSDVQRLLAASCPRNLQGVLREPDACYCSSFTRTMESTEAFYGKRSDGPIVIDVSRLASIIVMPALIQMVFRCILKNLLGAP